MGSNSSRGESDRRRREELERIEAVKKEQQRWETIQRNIITLNQIINISATDTANLGDNDIMTLDFSSLAKELASLNNIEELDMTMNNLKVRVQQENIITNDDSTGKMSIRENMPKLLQEYDKARKTLITANIDGIRSKMIEVDNLIIGARTDAARNLDNSERVRQALLESIKNLNVNNKYLNDSAKIIKKCYEFKDTMRNYIGTITNILDTKCTYEPKGWSKCYSPNCKLGDVTVSSNNGRKSAITNWACNSNGKKVKGNDQERYVEEEQKCDYTCPCVYSGNSAPLSGKTCGRTCTVSTSQADMDSYRKDAKWLVNFGLVNGPSSCKRNCDRPGRIDNCSKDQIVESCAVTKPDICQKSGFTNMSTSDFFPALANRPLEGKKHECPCKMNGKNDLSSVKPYYNDSTFSSSVSYDNATAVPVTIQKHRDQYLVLEKGDDANVYSDSWADKKDVKKPPQMDMVTQFYFGSLSIVALFVVFRMIQKTK